MHGALVDEPSTKLQVAYFGSSSTSCGEVVPPNQQIHLVNFELPNKTKHATRDFLSGQGWQLEEHSVSLDGVPKESTVLVLDEMFAPLISHISDRQFEAIQQLIQRKCRLLWVTVGGQMNVTLPEQGLFNGAARSIRAEDPTVMVMCLDVESNSGEGSLAAIHTALKHLKSVKTLEDDDVEFVERGGTLYLSRIVPDNLVNQSEKDSTYGPEPQVKPLHSQENCVRLISNRVGTLDSLQFAEVTDHTYIEDNFVEVEVHAAAMNFKVCAPSLTE